ncbi:transglutaminaseTgpA domain-containing protein [Streptomyces sp. NPDC014995]|uniref:transglutaminaseTgpA domain-containing protein n=1 Tax=Streptomyces sp. NPDC014995 TaxID=3364936 RepID=UPI003701B853
MAQAAPAPDRRPRAQTPPPDVFDERTHRIAKWAVPVVIGLVYGYWAAANRRGGGPVTGWNILFGFVTALVFVALYVAVRALAARLRREGHALLWSAFAGCAFGFLINQSGASVLYSAGVALVIAAGFFAVLFYRYYTHEDAEGRPVR